MLAKAFRLSRARRGVLCAGALLLAVVGPSAIAETGATAQTAAEPMRLSYTYDFYLGGVPIAQADFEADIDAQTYRATTRFATVGIVGVVFETELDSRVDGARFPANNLMPSVFEVESLTDRTKRFEMTMRFADAAPQEIDAEPPFRTKSYELDPQAQQGALDPITAIVAGFLPETSERICSRNIPVFDGRRRYDVRIVREVNRYREEGQEYLECDAFYVRIGGFKPSMMRTPVFPFRIRFALDGDGTSRAVRIWGHTNFGLAVALLRR